MNFHLSILFTIISGVNGIKHSGDVPLMASGNVAQLGIVLCSVATCSAVLSQCYIHFSDLQVIL